MKIELTPREIYMIVHAVTSAQFPEEVQQDAFDLVEKLREALSREQV